MPRTAYPSVAQLVGEDRAAEVVAALAVAPELRTPAQREAARTFLAAGLAHYADRTGTRPRPSTRWLTQMPQITDAVGGIGSGQMRETPQ